ncbi:hypothetical protein BKA69DRAFT_1170653 [Paraphysoderma sedebokerense]|nr:hypothetical protein BKA69DRAFT_1170653 [Paraphysoderma sedebokerense]
MTYNIEPKMISLVAIKNMDSPKVASPVGERNVGPSDETGPAGEPTILIPEINDETVTINFPLFYFGDGLKLPTFVNVLHNETVEKLLPDNFTKIHKSYIDDILEHVVGMDEEHTKHDYPCQVMVASVIFALYVACFSILIIITRSQLVLIFGIVLLFCLCLLWLCYRIAERSKKKRLRERALFDRLDGYCKQLTEASPRLFQKDITIQMIKAFDHKTSTLKSARLYKITDQSGSDIYTPVYFSVSFEVTPDTFNRRDLNEAISFRLYNLEVITND